MIPLAAILLSTAINLPTPIDPTTPLDCGGAFQARNALAREEKAILSAEATRGRLTWTEQERLDAVRKRRRQLLVCM